MNSNKSKGKLGTNVWFSGVALTIHLAQNLVHQLSELQLRLRM